MKSAIFTALLALAPIAATAQDVPVDDGFVGGVLNWEGVGRLALKVGIRSSADGNLVVCGAYASSGGPKYSRLNRQVLDRSRIVAGSTVLTANLKFFNQVNNAFIRADLIGAPSRCVNTEVPINSVNLSTFELDIFNGPYRDR